MDNDVEISHVDVDNTSLDRTDITPIGITLSKQILKLIDLKNSSTYFDFNNNGKSNKTSWVGPSDAILFYDFNHTQKADDFRKIVITAWSKIGAKTDFLAFIEIFLANESKVFDHNNKYFKDFYLWLDKNSNGQVETGELVSLEKSGIKQINFNTMKPVSDTQGGSVLNTAEVLWKDGLVTHAYDLVFKYQKNVTKNVENFANYSDVKDIDSILNNLNAIESSQYNILFEHKCNIITKGSIFNQKFVGFRSYYIIFVDGFSQIAKNITNVSQKFLENFLKISYIKHIVLNYTYKNELVGIKKVVANKCVKPFIKAIKNKHPFEWTKKDFKLLKLATHPDKCGNADDFIKIQNFQNKVSNTTIFYQDTLEKLNQTAIHITKDLHGLNIGVKLIDTGIDMIKMWYEPTQTNLFKIIINSINL